MKNKDKYYLRKEAEYILGCCEFTLRQLTKAGRLTKIKDGKVKSSRVYFDKTELDNLKKELRLERLNRTKFDFKDLKKYLYLLYKESSNIGFHVDNNIDKWIEQKIK